MFCRSAPTANIIVAALQDLHLATVVEILQSIKQADMSPVLSRIYSSPGGIELLDVLMKYLYVAHVPHPLLHFRHLLRRL